MARLPEWCNGANATLVTVTVAGAVKQITEVPALYIGAILRANAAIDTDLRVFNQKSGPTEASQEKPGIRTTSWNGFVNQPMLMENGIIATLSDVDARAWIIWIPLPPE